MNNKIKITDYVSKNVGKRCTEACNIKVNDLGLYQCFNCRAIFNLKNKSEKNYMINCLKYYHSDTWREKFEKLKTTKIMVINNRFKDLKIYRHSYKNDEKSKINTKRIFYEKIN